MGRRQPLDLMEKQILEHKVNVLSKIGQERNQYGYKKFKEREMLDIQKPSMYLRYKHLYDKEMAQEEDDVFKSGVDSRDDFLKEITKDSKEEDDFFIDPETVSKSKKKKLSKQMKFKPCDDRKFTTLDGDEINFEKPEKDKSKKRKREFGEHVCTPELPRQKQLDPKHYMENVNFIPIPEKSNKLLKKKKHEEKVEEEQ